MCYILSLKEDSLQKDGYPPGYSKLGWKMIKKIDTYGTRHDENHGVWFYYFIRNLFKHSGITSALKNATCDSAKKVAAAKKVPPVTGNTRKVAGATRDVSEDFEKDFDIKLRF